MKRGEKKAVERGVDRVMEEYYLWASGQGNRPPTKKEAERIARAAVRLAQLSAGRTYDDQTKQETIEYAHEYIDLLGKSGGQG